VSARRMTCARSARTRATRARKVRSGTCRGSLVIQPSRPSRSSSLILPVVVTAEPSSLLPKIKPVGKDSGEPQLWIRSRAGQDGQDTDHVVAKLRHVAFQEVPGGLVGNFAVARENFRCEADVGLGSG